MAVLSKEDYFTKLQTQIGTDTSEEAISFLEDMTDTYNDLQNKVNNKGVDWEQKYHDLDKAWSEKYRHRFFSGTNGGNIDSGDDSEEEDNSKTIQVEDLFQ